MWTILTLVSTLLSFSTTQAIKVKPENSMYGPYEAGGTNLNWWDLTGSAQLADSVIRLTTDEPWKQGAIWNSFPVLSNDWEFHMQFHIHGKGVHENGEGLAIWYVKESLHSGPVYGSKDYFSGLGIFIDTYENHDDPHKHKHPYISAVVNNGSFPYHHDEHGTAGEVGSCHMPLRNLEWPCKIAVSYISNVLTVFFDAKGTESWVQCFKAPGIHLPTGYFAGVSASTAQISDNHDIIQITSLDMSSPDKLWEDRSWMIPFAESVQIPHKTVSEEEEQEVEEKPEVKEQPIKAEEPVKQDIKHEVHEHKKPEEVFGLHEHAKPEVKVEHEKQKPEEKKKPDVKKEPVAEPPASLFRKAVYICGSGVILFVAVSMFRKYNAQRKERIQKRLY